MRCLSMCVCVCWYASIIFLTLFTFCIFIVASSTSTAAYCTLLCFSFNQLGRVVPRASIGKAGAAQEEEPTAATGPHTETQAAAAKCGRQTQFRQQIIEMRGSVGGTAIPIAI